MTNQASHIIEELRSKLHQAETNLISAKRILEKFERENLKPDYTQVDGIVGKFNGFQMITDDGKTYEVPANYSAKTKIVFGDTLKLIEENDKKLFKQIDRVDRTKIEGILTKKEGEWYILTDRGSYKVSDTAAEFQGAQLNSQATALIPTNKLDTPFATLDTVEGFGMNTKPVQPEEPVSKPAEIKPRPAAKRPSKPRTSGPRTGNKAPQTSAPTPKPAAIQSAPQQEQPKPQTAKTDISDDDLV